MNKTHWVEIRDVKIENQSVDKKIQTLLKPLFCSLVFCNKCSMATQKAFGTLHIASKLVLIISKIHKAKATSFTKCKRLEKLLTFSITSTSYREGELYSFCRQ
jgi:hypothetical protein